MSPAFAGSTFIRPHLNIGHGDDRPDGVNSLPELIKFVAEHNPDHLFGLQSKAGEDVPPCEITFAQLQSAVEYASAWLVKTGSTTGRTTRAEIVPPVAILLGSDIGIFIYLAALLRIGTPVTKIQHIRGCFPGSKISIGSASICTAHSSSHRTSCLKNLTHNYTD